MPQSNEAMDELESPSLTEKHLSGRYDLNRFKAVSLKSTQCSNWDKRIVWSTVLKAAESCQTQE